LRPEDTENLNIMITNSWIELVIKMSSKKPKYQDQMASLLNSTKLLKKNKKSILFKLFKMKEIEYVSTHSVELILKLDKEKLSKGYKGNST
jgi:hypothetical protein